MDSMLAAAGRPVGRLIRLVGDAMLPVLLLAASAQAGGLDYQRARWHPIHNPPQIERASNDDCLACHREVLTHQPRNTSPAGVSAANVLAWYQTLDTYSGAQSDFHVRHLKSEYAKQVMALKCTTCHQGNDPREEAISPPTAKPAGFTLRKMVDPNICLMCHGRMQHEIMGLPAAWPESREVFGNNCMTCHAAIRTVRHRVDFLDAENIEKLGAENGDVCYGCHGGRQWYRTAYPYPRHPWPGMAEEVPDWAKGRPAESAPRFRVSKTTSAGSDNDATR